MTAFRHLAPAALLALAASPAFADPGDIEGPVTHTDQLVVVTPNPPVVITNGAPGATQPAQVAAATPAPVNEPWDNVSHINGTPVKVGERGDYLLDYKRLNIATNPLGWMFGIYGLSVSEAVSPNVAIRADGNIFSTDGWHGYEVGISAPIYFRRVYSGPFLEPGIIARGDTDDSAPGCSDCSSSGSTMAGPEILFGWSWIFDSGLNVSAAFGAARDMHTDNGGDPTPAGYFRIGYAM